MMEQLIFFFNSVVFKINLFILFMYFWLHWVFMGEHGLLFLAVRGLLTAVVSLVAEHGL